MTRALLLFAKRPRSGKVKTRLIPALGTAGALGLYRAMLADAVANVAEAASRDCRAELCLDGPPGRGDPLPDPSSGAVVTLQGPGSLGDRLARAATRVRHEGIDAAVFLGADSPALGPERIEEAFVALERGSDAVVAPAADGGYVLVGCRPDPPVREALFREIPWGRSDVLVRTEARLAAAGRPWSRLPSGRDVDGPADLPWLVRALDDAVVRRRAPHTAAWVALHLDAEGRPRNRLV